ncbi:bis(5'-nucleosyl)-tetraphosphatase (symmetrical) YqeK [Fictibacillus gelatini]|uniref:bis(5'-nucleosyl)-tetraphosphatase (symmetrical) YqeK n=1 Tax=Fictibacillus gelatini TaxID=225985 RepID=UPI000418B2BF|nr:bis(5'-nucleosyl)-tetraphosphatase (symmetrical) YqeK [Fictibacillus gelatini]
MEREKALELVKRQLTDHRYEHTLGVVDTAVKLAEHYNADKKKAEIAAIFHDYAKFRPKEEMRQIVRDKQMPLDLLEFGTELLHAPVGAYLVEQEAGIYDQEILNAIRYHTTGRPGMNLLEKIIFIADYIEPGRRFPGVEEVRQLAFENLDKACTQALKNTMQFLMRQNQLIYPLTVDTYNDFISTIKKREET